MSACGGGSGGSKSVPTPESEGKPPTTPTGTLRVAVPGQTQTLDPTGAGTLVAVPVWTAVYDGLTRGHDPKDPATIMPALATSWETNSDATKWTIHLRKGVKFHDGEPFTAAAVKKSLEFFLRPGSLRAPLVGPVTKIATPDEATVVLSYSEPFPDLMDNGLSLKMLSPKLLDGPTKVVDKRVITHAVGTGPYVVDSFSSARGMVAHANPSYWAGGPHIAKLELRPIPEESARTAALQSGDVDLIYGITPRTAQTLEADSRVRVTNVPAWTTLLMNLAASKKPLNDVRVRQALAYAIDPAAILKNVALGKGTVSGSEMPPDSYGYVKPSTQYSYDPAKAKSLLAEAGISQPVKLSMVGLASMSDASAVGQALIQQAKAAGFDIKFRVEPDTIFAEIAEPQRKNDIFLLNRGWYGFPFHFVGGYVTSQTNYTDKKLLDLIKQMKRTPNGPEREKIIGDTLEESAKGLPEIPLYAGMMTDASVKALQNHLPPKDGYALIWNEQYYLSK